MGGSPMFRRDISLLFSVWKGKPSRRPVEAGVLLLIILEASEISVMKQSI
jgi:hypothetical protein